MKTDAPTHGRTDARVHRRATVIHVIPRGVFANTYQGSYKDTISRVRFFEAAGVDCRQVLVDDDDPVPVLGSLGDLTVAPRVLVEYSHYPRILRGIRSRWPTAFIGVRAHNIEPLQHLDNGGWWPKRGPLWVLYGMWRLLLQDIHCKRYADVLLPISDWEARVYWSRLPGRAKVEWLPYYCPDHLVPQSPMPLEQRRIIACLPTSQRNRKSWDLVTRFVRFAEVMKAAGSDYDFVVTGDLCGWGLVHGSAVSFVGMVQDLRGFLEQVRAVAMLSPLGYGFKTTIGDALAVGAQVIAHPALLRRCPLQVQSVVLGVETERIPAEAVSQWLATARSDRAICVHQGLRQTNHDLLDRLFSPLPAPNATS